MAPAVALEHLFSDDDAAAGACMDGHEVAGVYEVLHGDRLANAYCVQATNTSILLEPERATRFKPDSNQPVLDLLKWFNLGWSDGLPGLKPDHVQDDNW